MISVIQTFNYMVKKSSIEELECLIHIAGDNKVKEYLQTIIKQRVNSLNKGEQNEN